MNSKIIFLIFAVVGLSRAGDPKYYCTYNASLAGMPGGTVKEFLSLITTGVLEDFRGCPEQKIAPNELQFYLYNRLHKENPIKLDSKNLFEVDPLKKTIILFHGWLCNYQNDKMPELKDAYLERYDCNVIITDWSSLSIDLYSKSYCAVSNIAETMGSFVCSLKTVTKADITQMHFVGHSMGGQLAGLTAQQTQSQCNEKVGRITALDPAGPLYQGLPINKRLDKTDATRVDVIHTNMGFMGYYGACGSTDFFPNCGSFQPGCTQIKHDTLLDKVFNTDVVKVPVFDLNCNHIRSLDYMIESIRGQKPHFLAKKCDICPGIPWLDICPANLHTSDTAIMGEDCAAVTTSDKYTLSTNPTSPFAQG